jgi:YVTN family beta-propeller protein
MRLTVGLLIVLCACAPAASTPAPAAATAALTPVPLLLTPITTPQPLPALPPLLDSRSSKPLALDGDTLITVNPDSGSISLIDVPALRATTEILLGGSPRMTAAHDGQAFVTLWDANALSVIDLADRTAGRIDDVCHLPFGVVADERRVYVSCFGGDQIAVIDPRTDAILYRATVPDAPAGLALSGGWLLVTHLYTGVVTVLNVERTPFVVGSINVDTDGELARTIIVSPDGRRAYIPQMRTGLALISTQYMQDWFSVVSVFDLTRMTGDRAARLTLSALDHDVNMPSDAALSGDLLYVTLAGSDALLVIDPAARQLRARIPVGINPSGVLAHGDQVFVLNALDGTVSVIDARANAVNAVIPVTSIPLSAELLRGKILFNRASAPALSDGAISCATCHFEGGADGRTWINFRSGPRNTPALGGASLLPPFNWAGDMDELHDTIEDQIRSVMLGDGLIAGTFDATRPTTDAGRSADLDALAAYVASLRPWASPYRLPDGSLSESARRGMELFMSGSPGCGCHAPPLYADLQAHNLAGAVFSLETAPAFDTPTLRGLWATAPYLHDGVAGTLREVFTRTDPIHTVDLSEQQLTDLINFLLSL